VSIVLGYTALIVTLSSWSELGTLQSLIAGTCHFSHATHQNFSKRVCLPRTPRRANLLCVYRDWVIRSDVWDTGTFPRSKPRQGSINTQNSRPLSMPRGYLSTPHPHPSIPLPYKSATLCTQRSFATIHRPLSIGATVSNDLTRPFWFSSFLHRQTNQTTTHVLYHVITDFMDSPLYLIFRLIQDILNSPPREPSD
jgi:hypothetical protein